MKIVIAGATGTVGRHVVAAAGERGHDVVVLSRGTGQDLVTGAGVREAMTGAEAVIDVSSVLTTSAKKSVAFFEQATRVLVEAERAAGVGHHVALSIVGIDGVDASYYAGKLAQERAVQSSGRPWSILRAGQFHEFAEQVLPRGKLGPLTALPKLLMRPVAARAVGHALVDAAEAGPGGRLQDLVGPAEGTLADLARRMLRHDGVRRPIVELSLPGRYWKAARSGVLCGTEEARRGTITFEQWLASADHTSQRPNAS
jgi:uncharacterized protein YbjT (DUF2867 family)